PLTGISASALADHRSGAPVGCTFDEKSAPLRQGRAISVRSRGAEEGASGSFTVMRDLNNNRDMNGSNRKGVAINGRNRIASRLSNAATILTEFAWNSSETHSQSSRTNQENAWWFPARG